MDQPRSSQRYRSAEGQEIQAKAIYEKRQDFDIDWRKLSRWCLKRARCADLAKVVDHGTGIVKRLEYDSR